MTMTDNPPAETDEATLTVRRTIHIAAPVEKVWLAVTSPEHISQWFGVTEFAGAGVGATGTMTFEGYGAVPIRIEALEEPTSVTYRWGNDDGADALPTTVTDDNSTVFTFTLEAVEGGTQLTVVETGFENTSKPLENLRDHRTGWTDELNKLVALLEGAA
jgi:uncharacterized protein YndB with AHSA1/START domain